MQIYNWRLGKINMPGEFFPEVDSKRVKTIGIIGRNGRRKLEGEFQNTENVSIYERRTQGTVSNYL